MKGNKLFTLIYAVLAVAVSVGAVIFQHILENSYLDKNGLYTAGALTPEIFVIYTILSVLLILTVVFFLRFDIVPREMKTGTVNTAIFSVAGAIALVYSAILFFTRGNQVYYAPSTPEYMVEKLKLFAAIVAFVAALYYMVMAFTGKAKSKVVPYLSFFPLLWTLFTVMSMYFDRTSLINSPVKSLQQVALVVLMLYMLYEIRAQIGKTKMVASYILALMSTFFLSAAFVPTVIDIVSGAERLTDSNVHCVVGAVLALYTLSRAVDFAFYSEIDISKIIADRRREEQQKADKAMIMEQQSEDNGNGSVNPKAELEGLLDPSADSVSDGAEEVPEEAEKVIEASVEKTGTEDGAAEAAVEEAVTEESKDEIAEETKKTAEEAVE